MTNPKENPVSPDDDSQKWDLLAEMLGAKPTSQVNWDRPRTGDVEPVESTRKERPPGAAHKPPESPEHLEAAESSHWSAVAGTLGITVDPDRTALHAVQPVRAEPTQPGSPPPRSNRTMSHDSPPSQREIFTSEKREYKTAWDTAEDDLPRSPQMPPSAPTSKLASPFGDDDKTTPDAAASILSNLFGPSNSRLVGDPELENTGPTIRQVDDVEPIDEVRFETMEGSYRDFSSRDENRSSSRGSAESGGHEPRGERRGKRRRGRGRGRDRDRDQDRQDSERSETSERSGRTSRRTEPPRMAHFESEDELDSFGLSDLDDSHVEPSTWSGATPIEDLDDFDLPPEPPASRGRRDSEADYEGTSERGRRAKHPKLPSWLETVGIIVERNITQRNQSSGGGGGGNQRRRRGPRRRPSR